uniref:ATP synthase subunit a n=1 Tax=Neoseiulus womersleyi TaxID=322050 RepID=A0A8F6U410_9ACAR|nr:ATP synthase F0 subunit 6 [Neoseiulus womersleyi]
MMMNLFSVFDPSSSNNYSFNWLALFLPIIIYKKFYFKKTNRITTFISKLNLIMFKDTMNNLSSKKYSNMFMMMAMFYFFYNSNLMSIVPFIFTPNSHLSITLFFSMPFWLTLMIKNWFTTTNSALTHLVPLNTPLLLCPFMVLIETISNLIRPLTLAVRLAANMIAGHILLSLSSMLLNHLSTMIAAYIIINTLIILELGVALIQSYVFITLLTLYFDEV